MHYQVILEILILENNLLWHQLENALFQHWSCHYMQEILALLISIPGGIIAARLKGRTGDWIVSVFALVGLSAPCFIYGLLLILFIWC